MADIIDLDPQIVGFSGDPAHTAVYSVPSASMKVVEALINACWNEAQGNKTLFSSKITAALSTWLDASNAPHITAGTIAAPSIVEPVVTIPTSIDTSNVMSTFDAKRDELIALLVTNFVNFRTTYFPNESAGYAAAETWLATAIADPSGLPPTVIAQILGDEQARILSDKVRSQDAVIAQFASRRFPLPPDAAASAVLQIEQKSQDLLAEASRKLTAMSIELQHWNVEKLIGLRGMAMDAANKYIAALTGGADIASKILNVGYDAQSKLIQSVSSFYNARIQAAELTSKVAQYNNSLTMDADAKNQAADLQMIESKLKGLMTEAQALAQMTTALYNNLHTGATVSTTGGSSVNTSLV